MAKRVNKRFLVALTAVVLIGGVTAMAAMYVLPRIFKKSAEEQLAAAQQSEKEYQESVKQGQPDQSKIESALIEYGGAVYAKPNDPALRVTLGDVYYRYMWLDVLQYYRAAIANWDEALSLDPGNRDALDRLLDARWDVAQSESGTRTLAELRETASRAVNADANNAKAKQRLNVTVIRQATSNVPVSDTEVEDAVKALRELAQVDPANALCPYWAAIGELYLAEKDVKRLEAGEKAQEIVGRLKTSVPAMLKGQESNAEMNLRAGQIYIALNTIERALTRGGGVPATQPTGGPQTRPTANPAGEYTARVDAAFTAARQHAKLGDTPESRRVFVEIQLMNIDWLRMNGRYDEMRALAEELASSPNGDDPRIRLAYARLFDKDPERHEKLVALLSKPVDVHSFGGVEAVERAGAPLQLRYELASTRLYAAARERDPAKKKALIEAAEADVKQVEVAARGPTYQRLELKGRLRLVQDRPGEAIAMLQQSVDERGEPAFDAELMLVLADAYVKQRQTGQAEKLLQQIVSRLPNEAGPRLQLAYILLQDGRKGDARKELAELKARNPGFPGIAILEADIEGGAKREALLQQLPEGTTEERLRKILGYRAEGKTEEAIALARQSIVDDPKNLAPLDVLVNMYLQSNRRDEATAAVNEAIAADPANPQLKRFAEQLAASQTPEQLEQWTLKQIQSDPDVASREVKLYQFNLSKSVTAAQKNDEAGGKRYAAEAEQHLAAAEKAKPGDKEFQKGVMRLRFGFLVTQRRFDEATVVLSQLSTVLASDDPDGAQVQGLRYQLAMNKAMVPGATTASRNAALAEAEAAARELTRVRPQFAGSWQYLGSVQQAQGRLREAITQFNTALDRQGRNYEVLRALIECHSSLGEEAEAKAVLDRARESFPNDAYLREVALNHELNYGDPAKVVAERERLMKEQPKNVANMVALADAHLRVAGRAPSEAVGQQSVAKARAVLEAGRKASPNDASFLRPLSQVLLLQGDFSAGEKLMKDHAAKPEMAKDPAGDVLLAEFYGRANKLDLAEQSLRSALAKSEGNEAISANVREQLAQLLAGTGRFDDAIKELDGVNTADASRQRVQFLLAAGKAEEADKAIVQAVAAHPGSAELANLQVDMLINANRMPDAEKVLADRLAKNPADDNARYYVALVKLRKQPSDVPGAVRDLTDLSARNPRSVMVLSALADARYASKDISGAIDEMDRALKLAPLNGMMRAKMVEWCGQLGRWDVVRRLASEAAGHPDLGRDPAWLLAWAKADAAAGQFAEAEKRVAAAIELAPAERRPDLQREQVLILIQARNYKRVLQITDDMVAKGNKAWWVYNVRGMARAGLKDQTAIKEFDSALATLDLVGQYVEVQSVVNSIATHVGAKQALERVEKWEGNQPRYRLLAAELCFRQQDTTGALAHLQPLEAQVAQLPPDVQAMFYRSLAQAYSMVSPAQNDKSVDAFKKYIALQPGDILALNNLAYLLAEEVSPPRPQEAKQYSATAYAIARDMRNGEEKGRVFDTHGWVLALNGGADLDEGIRILQQVVDEFPILEAHYHLGEAQLQRNRSEEAKTQFSQALEMIERMKKEQKPFDEDLEPRIKRALDRARAINATSGAR